MSKSELMQAIDAQDTAKIESVLKAYPELDGNALTPNGLSALWVAFNPPEGKRISIEVVRFLLGYVKHNGEVLVNPTQAYQGRTASRDLEFFQRNLAAQSATTMQQYIELTRIVSTAENNYVAPQGANPNAQNLGGLVADAQNVHDRFVSKLAKSNLASLYQHYVIEQKKAPDSEALRTCRATLGKAIDQLKQDKAHQKEAVQMENGLDFCAKSTTRFELTLESNQSVSMTLSEVVALLGHAIEEEDESLLFLEGQDKNPKEEARKARIEGVLGILYDNATAYGLNKASCEGGAFNRFGFALAARHRLVKTESGEPLTGEIARMEMFLFFKKPLEKLKQDNLPLYWRVVRHELLDNPTDKEDTEAYEHFVGEHLEEWKKTLIEAHRIDAQEAENFTLALGDAYPYHQHEQTRNLVLLLPLITTTEQGKVLLAELHGNYPPDEALEKVLSLCAQQLAQQPQWREVLLAHQLKPTQDFAHLFLRNALAHCRQNGAQEMYVTALFHPSKPLSEDALALAKKILYRTAFEQQKDTLIAKNPEQKEWLIRLTQDERLDLLETLAQHHPKLSQQDLSSLMPQLIEIALQKGYLRGLSLKGMTFEDRDWRGFALDGVDLEGATFRRCDLRLVSTQGANLKGVHLENSRLPYFNQKIKLDENKLKGDFFGLAHSGDPLSVLGALQQQNNLGVQLLLHCEYWGGDSAFLRAMHGRTDTVKLLLEHPCCTEQVFNQKGIDGNTALLSAAADEREDVVKLLLEHPYCTEQVFNQKGKDGNTALLSAARNMRPNIARLLLTYRNCSIQNLMDFLSIYPEPYLRYLNPKPILLETYMALLEYRDSAHSQFTSFFGIRSHRLFVVKLLEEAPSLTPKIIHQKVCDYVGTKKINPEGHFQRIINLVNRFPQEFKLNTDESAQESHNTPQAEKNP